jgi:chemotaxis signal transduction protein
MVSTADVLAPEGVVSIPAPQWVVFACDGHHFGVPLALSREILPPREFTRLPGCGPEVCGLLGLRGRVITVFDFGAVLGLRGAAIFPDNRLLLLDHGEVVTGFLVDEIIAVVRAEARAADAAELPADLLFGLNGDDVLGIVHVESEEPFIAIDAEHILKRLLV